MKARSAWGRVALIACVAGSLVIPPASVSAAPTGQQKDARFIAPAAIVAAKAAARVTIKGGPRLHVQLAPARTGQGAWRFTLERSTGTSWEPAGDYLTEGTTGQAAIPVASGIYRVVVPAQNGHPATTSAPLTYRPTPEVNIGGHGALEVAVGPIRAWQVALERKTDQGWTTATTARTRGLKPVVFTVDAGTYRVRTEANGRFPAYLGTPFDFEPQAPPGPVPYGLVDSFFADRGTPSKATRAATPRANTSDCSTGYAAEAALGFLNFIPIVGGALAAEGDVAVSAASNSDEEGCITAEFEIINQQLAYQQEEIQQIQYELSVAKSVILDAFYATSGEITNSDLANWNSDVQGIAGCPDGQFTNFMTEMGFWNSVQCADEAQGISASTVANPNADVSSIATSNFYGQGVSTPWGTPQSFQQALEGAAGNYVDCSGTDTLYTKDKLPDCWNQVVPQKSGDAQNLLDALNDQLSLELASLINSQTNEVPAFDQYNNAVTGYYEQAVTALQQAYSMEYTINQLNYFNAGKSDSDYIPSMGNVTGTFYAYQLLPSGSDSASDQIEYYNAAQLALTKVYVARANQLYTDTLGYLVTDTIAGGQTWPQPFTGAAGLIDVDYASEVGAWLGGDDVKVPLATLPSALQATSGGGAVFYQANQIRNAQECYGSLVAWNKANGSMSRPDTKGNSFPTTFPSSSYIKSIGGWDAFCPAILVNSAGGAVSAPAWDTELASGASLSSCGSYADPANDAQGSCFDGNTYYPYYVAANGVPTIGSAVLGNVTFCDGTSPNYTWFEVGAWNTAAAAMLTLGDVALTCGNWYPVGAPNSQASNTVWGDSVSWNCPADGTSPDFQSSLPYCNIPNGLWIGFEGPQGTGDEPLVSSYTTLSSASVQAQNYYINPENASPASLYYVSADSATPINIGGPKATTTITISGGGDCFASSTLNSTPDTSWCTVEFDPLSDFNGYCPDKNCYNYQEQAESYAVGAPLPSQGNLQSPTGSPVAQTSGFYLPLTFVAAHGQQYVSPSGSQACVGNCTLLTVYLPSATGVESFGFTAPASTLDANGYMVSGGYITVADGSCWEMNVSRTSDNDGQVSFTQQPGAACPYVP